MSKDCRNDCIEALIFPKRPNNRPGLSHIEYRIGTYSDFREALLRNLNRNALLSSWTHRCPDDPGIALIEGASILGDILTFYQELYANDAYLRTAQWRESISDLVRLLGYRLSPGLGGKATFAFEVKGDKPVTIPKGFPIKAQVEGLEQPADFETTEEKTAYPWLSKFNLYRRLFTPNITQDTKEFYIFPPDQYTSPVMIEKGDRLLIGDPYPSTNPTRLINGEIVIVDGIRELHGRKLYKIKGDLKKRTASAFEIVGFKLGRSFRHFGHNSPSKVVSVSDGVASETSVSYERLLNNTPSGIFLHPDLGPKAFPLDTKIDDLSLGTPLICETVLRYQSGGITYYSIVTFALIRTIQEVRQISYTWSGMTGSSTLVILDSKLTTTTNPAVDTFYPGVLTFDRMDIRDVQFYEVLSPLLRLRAGVEETSEQKGKELYFYGTDSQAQNLKDRMLGFTKVGSDPFVANVVSVQTLSSGVSERPLLRRITLDREVSYADFLNEKPIVTVYGNLVAATQGKTEKEAVLGNGDNRQIFQTFKLPKSPLTYHNSLGETPPEAPELQIYVNDRLWKRVASFFGRGSKEEIYIVREDEKGDSWVQFGDGKTGARLPSGIENVVAKYRTGTGAYGALKEGTTVQSGGKLDRLNKVQLLGVASGGSEPETGEKAREAAPGKIQSLDRLVSLKDFESETLAISGVSKVKAVWDLVNNIPAVVLTVLMETGRDAEFTEVQRIINNYNKCRGPQRFPIEVRQGKLLYVYIDAVFGLHPAFREDVMKKAIKEALGLSGEEGNGIDGLKGLFGLYQRQFGQNEYATRIQGVIQNIDGVVWAEVKALGSLGESSDPLKLGLPNEPKPFNLVISCDNLHILSLYKDHLQLNASKAESKEAC